MCKGWLVLTRLLLLCSRCSAEMERVGQSARLSVTACGQISIMLGMDFFTLPWE